MTARQSFAFFQHWRSRFQQDDGENEVSIERLREVGIEGFKFWPSLSVCCARYLEKKLGITKYQNNSFLVFKFYFITKYFNILNL